MVTVSDVTGGTPSHIAHRMNARQMLRAQSQPQSGSGHRLPVLFSNGGRLVRPYAYSVCA